MDSDKPRQGRVEIQREMDDVVTFLSSLIDRKQEENKREIVQIFFSIVMIVTKYSPRHDDQLLSAFKNMADSVSRTTEMVGRLLAGSKASLSAAARLGNENQSENANAGLQTVEIKVVFSRILNIDTIAQQYEAEVYVQARWTEHQFAGLSEQELNSLDFSECWNPKLTILNKAGQFDMEKISFMIQYEEEEIDPVVTYMWRMKGLFRENLELAHFPFDVQEMSIVVSSERTAVEIDLQPDSQNQSNVSHSALQESHEWRMFRHVEFTKDFTTTEFIQSSKHPVLLGACHARRRLGFYMWNIVVIVVLILCLTLTVLAIDPTSADRLIIIITLFLTAVAFKLVVKASLPTISYLTYLDIYMVFTMMYLATQAGENAIMVHLSRFKEAAHVQVYDEIAQSVLISLLILFHAIFLVYIQLTAFSRRRSMYEKDHEFHVNKMKLKIRRRQQGRKNSIKSRAGTNAPSSNQTGLATPQYNRKAVEGERNAGFSYGPGVRPQTFPEDRMASPRFSNASIMLQSQASKSSNMDPGKGLDGSEKEPLIPGTTASGSDDNSDTTSSSVDVIM